MTGVKIFEEPELLYPVIWIIQLFWRHDYGAKKISSLGSVQAGEQA